MLTALVALDIVLTLAVLAQLHRQHDETLKWIDAIGEMVGEALEEKERDR